MAPNPENELGDGFWQNPSLDPIRPLFRTGCHSDYSYSIGLRPPNGFPFGAGAAEVYKCAINDRFYRWLSAPTAAGAESILGLLWTPFQNWVPFALLLLDQAATSKLVSRSEE